MIQHKPGDLILHKEALQFFISREQTCPFSLNDFYFRLMETTKTGKSKYMSPGRARCVTHGWELAQQQFGCGGGKGFALEAAAHGNCSPRASTALSQGNRGSLRAGWKSVWLGQGNGAHGKQGMG